MAKDSKEAKLEAFNAFSFDTCEAWLLYKRTFDAPSAAAMTKAKAKFYKREVDEAFDIAWVQQQAPAAGAAAAAGATAGAAAAAPRPQQQPSQRAPPPQHAAWRAPGAAVGSGAPMPILDGLALALFLAYMLSAGATSAWVYNKALLVLTLTHGSRVILACGRPAAVSLSAAKAWLGRALRLADCQKLVILLAALASRPVSALLIPYVISATYSVGAWLDARLAGRPLWAQYGQPVWGRLQGWRPQAGLLVAQSLVTLPFVTLLARQVMLALVCWRMLILRSWAADQEGVTIRQLLQALDQQTLRFRQRLPLLQAAVAFGQRQFQAGRPPWAV